MDLPNVKPVLDKEFVQCWIDTDRMKGGTELLAELRGGAQGGIPWFVVMEPDGTPVVDADDLTGGNLGCPHTEAEVETFGKLLAKAAQRITEAEIATVVAAFHEAGARGEARRKAQAETVEGQ